MTKIMEFDITDLVVRHKHHIESDKIVFYKTNDDGRTLLKQLEDTINTILKNKKQTEIK